MKRLSLSLLLNCCVLPQLLADGMSSIPRLEGILSAPDLKLVILEVVPTHPGQGRFLTLSEGQRDGDVEVIRIDPEGGSVKARVDRTNGVVTLKFESSTNTTGKAGLGIVFDRADINPVLRAYSLLTGRTLLRSPRLPAVSFSLSRSATNQAEMAVLLEHALSDKNITSIPDGDKFLMIVPNEEAVTVRPRSSEIKPRSGSGDRPEVFPAGTLTFFGADLNQVAAIYATLIGRKLERAPRSDADAPTGTINLQTQTSLTREECLYALDTLFRWQGAKIVEGADGTAKLVRISEAGK